MAFRSIGVILAELTNDRSKLQAAADIAPRMKGGPLPRREVRDSGPIAQAAGGTASNLNEVDGNSGESARPVSGAIVKEPTRNEPRVLPVGRSKITARAAAQKHGTNHVAVVFDLAIERQRRHLNGPLSVQPISQSWPG